jgi:protein TonB
MPTWLLIEPPMLPITSVRRGDPESEWPTHPIHWAFAWSAFLHLLGVAVLMAFSSHGDLTTVAVKRRPAPAARIAPMRIVVLEPRATRAARGGGGGGNRQSGPIRRAESRGSDRSTLRIAKPIATSGVLADVEERLPALLLDARPLSSGVVEQLGLPSGGTTVGTSTGPGSGGGVGDGVGTGIGSGRGPGMGPGSGGGAGGGVYRPGGAVTSPQLLSQVRPTYTVDAVHQRIQGSVVLELVVTSEGAPSEIRVVQSLDPAGLDKEAIKAVRQWRFTPGRLADTPVNVLVTVVLDFTIR